MSERKKSVRRRAHLYETAKHLFETKGYDNTSVDQIVSAAGVAKGTFYYYFESKEDILQAMLEEIDGGWGVLLDPVVNLAVCAAEKLRLCISILRRHYAEAPSPLLVYNDVAV